MEAFVNGRPLFETLRMKAHSRETPTSRWPVLAFFLLLAIFLVITTRSGHSLGDDFTMYLSHARNLAEGRPYAATGYVYNPGYPTVGPHTYPPIYPLLIAPVYRFYGMNLEALKAVSIAAAWLSVLLFFLLWRKQVATPALLALLALLAFNPVICTLKDSIISDLPFLCWLGLGFLLIERFYEQERLFLSRGASAALLGATIYLAYGTRSIGLMLLVSLVLYELWHTRWIRPLTLEVIGVTACLMALQNLFVHSDGGYADQFTITVRNVLENVKQYVSEYSAFWGLGYPRLLRYGLLAALGGLAVWGWLVTVKQRVTYLSIFALLYMLPILLVSLEIQRRYLIPLMPATLYFAWRGGQHLGEFFSAPRWLTHGALATLALVIAGSYALVYARADWRPYNEGVSRAETQQVADFLRKTAAANDTLVFIKPRTMALLTERKTAAWHSPKDENDLWRFWQKIGARYVITGPNEVEPERQAYLQQLIARHADKFEALYANADYRVYRIK